jgi:hypothetical protein
VSGHVSRSVLMIAVWAIALVLIVFAGMRTRTVMTAAPSRGLPSIGPAPRSPRAESPKVLAAAAELLVARDPFRLERRPAAVPYSPAMENAPPPPPRPPRPTLVVTGIIGGPPWEALLEGIPGRQGSVLVRRGDTLAGLHVRAVGRDSVRIVGMDTTWMLTVRRGWQ